MEIKTYDLLLLFVLAICVSLVIAINVFFIVNKKLQNLKIDVPKCPQPIVYINGSKAELFYNKNEKFKDNTQSIEKTKNVTTFMMGNNSDQIIKENIDLYQPKMYNEDNLYGTLNGDKNNKETIEVDADIDQIGSSLTNNYNGEVLPIGSIMFKEYY
jgi:hypothetical protein